MSHQRLSGAMILAALTVVAATGWARFDDKPPLKITPGKAIVPLDKMRRIWGELVSLDLKTRTGVFRNEGNDELMTFTVMPYAELLHHAAFGDLQDYRVGERAIFRLHEDAAGKWNLLTYIQDEMNFLNGHKEYYHVDKLDAAKGRIAFSQANADKSFVREGPEKGLFLDTDKDTRYWKNGEQVKFSDIQIGDKLRAKTHGLGKGKVRVAWEIFLDEASLLKWQKEEQAVHQKRMAEEGLPGYVDERDGQKLKVTLFRETGEATQNLKSGQKVKLSMAGVDRKPTGAVATATVGEIKTAGGGCKLVTLTCDAMPGDDVKPPALVRVWLVR